MKKTVILVLLVFLTFSMAKQSAKNKDDSVSAQYKIGDIILADGSIVKEDDLVTVDRNNVPIAIIAGFQEDGTAFGIGVHRSDTPLQWAADDSVGYTIRFTDTVCMQESDFGFSGDKDGSDNWEAMCVQDGEDTVNAAEKYPAFDFVKITK